MQSNFDKLFDFTRNFEETKKVREFRANNSTINKQSICVVGGGTAGYLSAIAIKTHFPQIRVTLVESERIPIIGVGEATVYNLPLFLHKDLKLDIVDFYKKVLPTWKLGIRFEWGTRADYFYIPFGWAARSIGLLGSLHFANNMKHMNLQTTLMEKELSCIFKHKDSYRFPFFCYAYHLDNELFVAYLQNNAVRLGVKRKIAHINDVIFNDNNEIKSLVLENEKLDADFFVDCSGFKSILINKKLKSKFNSFKSDLFNDRALTFNLQHNGKIKPFTTSTTMDAGWCWNTPLHHEDHLGYVYSSDFIDEEKAREEIKLKYPDAPEPKLVTFSAGRHDKAWIGNVFAVGNSFGFVEPLQSTGIFMITTHIEKLISILRSNLSTENYQCLINNQINRIWDSLRWFIAVHFKFNPGA